MSEEDEEEEKEGDRELTESGRNVFVRMTKPLETATDDVRCDIARMRSMGHRRTASAPSPSPPPLVQPLASSPGQRTIGRDQEEDTR